MKLKEKNWVWKLTYPFAHDNYTLIYKTLYCPKAKPPPQHIVDHEYVHIEQIKKVGWFKFYFLYLFALPFGWNRWRRQWETEAYKKSHNLSDVQINNLLAKHYGLFKDKSIT